MACKRPARILLCVVGAMTLAASGRLRAEPPLVLPPATDLQQAPNWIQQADWLRAEQVLRRAVPRAPSGYATFDPLLSGLRVQALEDKALSEAGRPLATKRLLGEADYLALLAAAYFDRGDYGLGVRVVRAAAARLQIDDAAMPPALEVQFCRLLIHHDPRSREPYELLIGASKRENLSAAQIADYRELWVQWSLHAARGWRRSKQLSRAATLLASASKSYPQDLRIRSALGQAYLEAGQTAAALAVYEGWDACGAAPSDCEGAIASALAMGERAKAERWLRKGLRRWPSDPSILTLAGRHSAQRGLYADAFRFWKQAVAAPAAPPTRLDFAARASTSSDWTAVSWSEAVTGQTSMRPRSVITIFGLGPEPLTFGPGPVEEACNADLQQAGYCTHGD